MTDGKTISVEFSVSTAAVIKRFNENRQGFWRSCGWLIGVFIVALLCDAASTTYFMLQPHPGEELHPAVNLVSDVFGPIGGPLIGFICKAVAGLTVAIYLRRWAAYVLFPASIIAFWAAWYNVWGVHSYCPKLSGAIILIGVSQ